MTTAPTTTPTRTPAANTATAAQALATAQAEGKRLQRARSQLKERHDAALINGDAGATIAARRGIEEVDAQLDVLRITEARHQVAVCEADLDALTGQVDRVLVAVNETDAFLDVAREAYEAAATAVQSARGQAMGVDNRIAARRFDLAQRKQTLEKIIADATQRFSVGAKEDA